MKAGKLFYCPNGGSLAALQVVHSPADPTLRTVGTSGFRMNWIPQGDIFMIIDPKPIDTISLRVVKINHYITPMLVLHDEKIGLIEFFGRTFCDATPWPVGDPNHKHNVEILKFWRRRQ